MKKNVVQICNRCSSPTQLKKLQAAKVVVALRDSPHQAAAPDEQRANTAAVELDRAEHEPLGHKVERGDAEGADGEIVEAGASASGKMG